jgi:hypothetical protein
MWKSTQERRSAVDSQVSSEDLEWQLADSKACRHRYPTVQQRDDHETLAHAALVSQPSELEPSRVPDPTVSKPGPSYNGGGPLAPSRRVQVRARFVARQSQKKRSKTSEFPSSPNKRPRLIEPEGPSNPGSLVNLAPQTARASNVAPAAPIAPAPLAPYRFHATERDPLLPPWLLLPPEPTGQYGPQFYGPVIRLDDSRFAPYASSSLPHSLQLRAWNVPQLVAQYDQLKEMIGSRSSTAQRDRGSLETQRLAMRGSTGGKVSRENAHTLAPRSGPLLPTNSHLGTASVAAE